MTFFVVSYMQLCTACIGLQMKNSQIQNPAHTLSLQQSQQIKKPTEIINTIRFSVLHVLYKTNTGEIRINNN